MLAVDRLNTRFDTPEGEVAAVNDVSFTIQPGETIGIVGESGSGKSQVFLSIMGLLAINGRATGSVRFRGEEVLGIPRQRLNRIRGRHMSMIFQDPMTSLNPYLKVSQQLNEVLMQHMGLGQREATKRSIAMLDLVRIPEASRRIDMYPHEFSGGMRQRVMIAMALLCQPGLLIADEPTTALDVTVQAQILDVMEDLRCELQTAIVLITHDMGVIARLSDRVMVMYGGRVVETGPVQALFDHPQHPYTAGLLRAMPRVDRHGTSELYVIPGQPPNLQYLPAGCAYQDRCPHVHDRCLGDVPPLIATAPGRAKACFLDQIHSDA